MVRIVNQYYPFSQDTYQQEANVIQQRVNNRTASGKIVTSDEAWGWIKERHPTWPELDREKVFQLLKL
jgi:hypothetical protein